MGPGYQHIFQVSAEDETSSVQAVCDHYRCPSQFLDFRIAKGLSRHKGFFQFGPDAVCYGSSLGDNHRTRLSDDLIDLLSKVSSDKSGLILPFDPNEIIDNLRLERYPCSRMGKYEKSLKSLYYQLRPMTNRSMRVGVQRLRAANWNKRRFPQWPVDTTVENIGETLLLLALKAGHTDSIPFIWFWPNGAHACVAMTHDVETTAGRDFAMQLADIDQSFGIKASYHIVPEKRYEVTPEYLSELRTRGCEVCVQDLNHDGRLFDERQEFLRRVAEINRYGREYGAKGFRSAILYRNIDWYKDLEFSFDMTIPNVAHLDPQRGGCCTVMPYFIGDILELPLTTVQDYTLFHVLNERSIDLWKMQFKKILSKNGMATFLVHPDYVIESDTRAVYKELLDMLRDMRKREALWFALPGEIDTWWRQRSQMSIVRDGGSWRIAGEGSERAVLAFAKVVKGKLVYEHLSASRDERQLSNTKKSRHHAIKPVPAESCRN